MSIRIAFVSLSVSVLVLIQGSVSGRGFASPASAPVAPEGHLFLHMTDKSVMKSTTPEWAEFFRQAWVAAGDSVQAFDQIVNEALRGKVIQVMFRNHARFRYFAIRTTGEGLGFKIIGQDVTERPVKDDGSLDDQSALGRIWDTLQGFQISSEKGVLWILDVGDPKKDHQPFGLDLSYFRTAKP